MKACCLFVLLFTLVARGDLNFCSRIIDAGSTKVVPFDDTFSPDRNFVIGWTAFAKRKDALPINWAKWNSSNIEDFFFSDNSIDLDGDFYGVTDVLIDLKNKTFLALPSDDPAIPRKNREYLFAVWGPVVNGVRHGLVENDSRFYTENLWLITIDSGGMHAVDLAPKLTKAVEPILQAKRPFGARDYETFFHNFDPQNSAISFDKTAVSMPFISDLPKSMVQASAINGTIIICLSDSEIVNISSASPIDDPFTQNVDLEEADQKLNQTYMKLAKSLGRSEREELKREELAWIQNMRDPIAEKAMESISDPEHSSTPEENRDKVLLRETLKRQAELQGRLK